MKFLILISAFFILIFGSSCYRQNIMFETDEFKMESQIEAAMKKAEAEYILRPDDRISLKVETNKGETLIDPNFQLRSEFGMGNLNNQQSKSEINYLIRPDGKVKLPMVDDVSLAGYSIRQADSILRIAYQKYYKDPFVITQIKNRRVYIFNGENGQVIPIENENTSLIEVLALSGGIGNRTNASNIRLIRGDLNKPYVEVINLRTIQGMQAANLELRNQDIIYVEPVRRVVSEATRDIAPIINLITSTITLIVILTR